MFRSPVCALYADFGVDLSPHRVQEEGQGPQLQGISLASKAAIVQHSLCSPLDCFVRPAFGQAELQPARLLQRERTPRAFIELSLYLPGFGRGCSLWCL